MMKKLLKFSMIAALSGVSFSAFAQTAPIFIQKYSQPTTTSNIPSIVTASSGSQTTSGYTAPTYELVDSPNPWEGTDFGKITSEIDYYDSETGQRYDQYNYMALLAKRGDRETLSEVGNYLQSNGVFDRQQYQSAVNSAAQGNAIPSTLDQALAKEQLASANTGAQIGQPTAGGAQQQQPITAKPKFVIKDQEDYAPKRLHQAYDEDMKDQPTQAKPKTNQPIFLR